MLTVRQQWGFFAKSLGVGIGLIFFVIFVGGWAVRPYMDAHSTFDGPPTYLFRFVQPSWLRSPNDWPLAESIARIAVVGHAVLATGMWFWSRRRKKQRLKVSA
jgi:hypothetical protein